MTTKRNKITDPAKLSARQRRFVEEYLVDLCAAKAARRAGYSEHSACDIGQQLLHTPAIQTAIEALRAAQSERTQITADRVLEEFGKLGFANMLDYVALQDDGTAIIDLSAIDRDKAAAIHEMVIDEFTDGAGEDGRPVKRIRFKLHDKHAALVSIGRHLNMFTDKTEITGKDGAPIVPILNVFPAGSEPGAPPAPARGPKQPRD